MNLNKKFTSLAKIGFKYNEFVENAQNEESAIYFKGNKFGEEVPIKKTNKYDKYCTGVEEGVLFIKYFPNLANLKLKINFSYILL